jgi:hypothetical protein
VVEMMFFLAVVRIGVGVGGFIAGKAVGARWRRRGILGYELLLLLQAREVLGLLVFDSGVVVTSNL